MTIHNEQDLSDSFTDAIQPVSSTNIDHMRMLHELVSETLEFFNTRLAGGFSYTMNEFSMESPCVELNLSNTYTPDARLTITLCDRQPMQRTLFDVSAEIDTKTAQEAGIEAKNQLPPEVAARFHRFVYEAMTAEAQEQAHSGSLLGYFVPKGTKPGRNSHLENQTPNAP